MYQEKQIQIHVSGCMDLETSNLKPLTCRGQAVPPVEVASVNARFQGAHDGVCLQLNVAFKQPLVQIFEWGHAHLWAEWEHTSETMLTQAHKWEHTRASTLRWRNGRTM